ncbi:MAG: hypothetical protein EBU90_31650 [Proteobacteria bacterium]|nr:hypothetical protein [Pseudomonadota bacterium]
MALAKVNLGFPVVVSAGTTASVYSVGSAKTAYIRSIVIFNSTVGTANTGIPQTVQIYVVPNSGGSVGIATSGNRIGRVSLTSDDTFFYDLQYPITLQNTGDSIQVFNEGSFAWTLSGIATATNPVNVMVLGDREL